MGWATAHFQFCVATLQWCRDMRGAAYTASASTRTTEHLCARACHGRVVATDLLELFVATKLAHPVSRQGFLVSRQGVGQLGLLVLRHYLLCCHNGALV